jgi:hypothetical protein
VTCSRATIARAAGSAPSTCTGRSRRNIPRAFFVFLPMFAHFLKLLYRKQAYLVEHLVFSLYYHAFVFLTFSLIFAARPVAAARQP